MIGIGNVESTNESIKWLNEQVLSLFSFITLNDFSYENKLKIITKLIPNVCQKTAKKLLTLTHSLRESDDLNVNLN